MDDTGPQIQVSAALCSATLQLTVTGDLDYATAGFFRDQLRTVAEGHSIEFWN